MTATFEVTAVKQTVYKMTVVVDKSYDAEDVLRDRLRNGQLDGIEVTELGITDIHVHRMGSSDGDTLS